MRPERGLVWLAEVPFAGPPHRQQHLARLLGDRYHVVYVEPPPPLTVPGLGLSSRDGLLVAQVAPLANARPLRRFMSRPVGLKLARLVARLQLRRLIVAAGLGPRTELTIVCSNVFLFDAARGLQPRKLVADMCDDPRYYPGEPPWTGELLRRAVRAADVVTTSSRALEAEFLSLGVRRLAYVPNGIHAAFLREAVTFQPTASFPPVLGFVGYLGPWVDFELLSRLAAEIPECHLELVGPVAHACRAELDALLAFPNVHYRPAIPYAEVPSVLAHFSVGLIPFRLSAYTRAVNPIKLYEYAALNLPVVCTRFSPDVVPLQPAIDVCATPEAFVRIARTRAGGRGRRPTRQIAEAHTWEQISRSFAEVIDSPPT